MANIKIAAVSRAGVYSPNHIGNDAAILHAVVDQLRKRGCEVTIYNEDSFLTERIEEDVILNMCRKEEAFQKLQNLEDEGKLVINSGYGIENCIREQMTRLLVSHNIPYPESLIADTNSDVRDELCKGGYERCWVKRGESYAMHKEDVSYCRHTEEVQELLHEFFYRGIKRAVINKHLDGDLVKFYGLGDGSFFYWFYPLRDNHSKFGDENINGREHNYRFDEDYLKEISLKAAEVVGIEIFGGDCIISTEGEISIIDFNDWPSFAPCRDVAAPLIARRVMTLIKERRRRQRGEERAVSRRATGKENVRK